MFEAIAQGFPVDSLAKVVPVVVPVVKVVQLILVAAKYQSSRLQPFARMAYQFGSLAALCKLGFFAMYHFGDPKAFPGPLLQDLSFILALTGVVVTLALDFLWALSSSMEKGALFHHDLVASDVALRWYALQVPIVIVLASLRYFPWPFLKELALEGAVNVVLILSFGFVWYCLCKVYGASKSFEFKNAYRAAFIVNIICTLLVSQNIFFFMVLCWNPSFVEGFKLQEHSAEGVGIFVMLCYFMYVKEQPQAIHDHMHDLDRKKSGLQHKSTFGGLVGIQCPGNVVQQPGVKEPLV